MRFIATVLVGVPLVIVTSTLTAAVIVWLYAHPRGRPLTFLFFVSGFALMLGAASLWPNTSRFGVSFFGVAFPFVVTFLNDARRHPILVWLKQWRARLNLPMNRFWQQISDEFYWG